MNIIKTVVVREVERSERVGNKTIHIAGILNGSGSVEGERERERERDSLLIMRYKCTSARELLCSLQPYMIQLKIVENIKPAS